MNKTKSFLVCLAVIGVVFVGLKLFKQGPQTTQAKQLTISKAWWPVWDTFQIGVNRHEKVKKSFQTTFNQTQDYGPALEEFKKENVDASTLTIYEAIQVASAGADIKIVLLLDYTIGSDGVVAKKEIHTLQDLKGKRIGIEIGTIAHFTVLKALEQAGLDQTEVEFVNLGTEALKKAFINNEIDAAGIYEPYISNMAQKGNGHIIFSSKEIPRAICDVLFVKESVTREHPEAIDHWIKAWDSAIAFKRREPENYLHILSELNGTSVSDLSNSFKGIFFTDMMENKIAFGTSQRPGYLLDSLKEMEGFMIAQGIIPQHLDLQDLVYFDGIQRFFNK
jgi:NitT/TauT family transport system substrate-binding protein